MALSGGDILLGELKIGAAGHITGFSKAPDIAPDMIDRLREIGFSEGLSIEVLHQSPFGKDPIAVKVGAMTVALRRRDANLIEVATL